MQLKAGDLVKLKSSRQTGVIIKIVNKTRCQVQVGSITLNCKAADLEQIAAPKSAATPKKHSPRQRFKSGQRKIDLHGMRVKEAIEYLENEIDKAHCENLHQLEIVHGIGTGKVKNAVIKYLNESDLVRGIRQPDGNPGTTIAYL